MEHTYGTHIFFFATKTPNSNEMESVACSTNESMANMQMYDRQTANCVRYDASTTIEHMNFRTPPMLKSKSTMNRCGTPSVYART